MTTTAIGAIAMDEEVWRNVVGYEGLYMVSNLGNFRSFPKKSRHCDECEMTKRVGSGGYLYVHLRKDGKSCTKLVHRLVAEAFIENDRNKSQVNHLDGNKQNNNVENLEWVTCSENQIHAYRVLNRKRKSDHSPRPTKRRFTKEQVLDIRNSKKSQSELAREYRTSQNVIWCIVNRKTYQEI